MNTTTLTVCAIQPVIFWQKPARTFDSIAGLLAQAAAVAPLDVAVLPEHFNATPTPDGDDTLWQTAQAFAAELARHHRINLVAGSVERWDAVAQARVNTTVVYDRGGCELGRYDKRRLFGFEKRRNVRPGNGALALEVEGTRLGVLICSDLWHPELARHLAAQVELLCVPAQTTIRPESAPAYARMLWHTLAMTRAQENVLAVVVSDQAATSQAPFRCGGVSSITDPSAEPVLSDIQQVLADGSGGYLLARLDRPRLARFRSYRQENGLLPAPPAD
ncbi:MAG TPA: carbon-nitrogen hydrolase family protein [Anaerolineae bacterium]|nr:carbon-nitrogen hydrolase family protein [Anaerolineae bacterium]